MSNQSTSANDPGDSTPSECALCESRQELQEVSIHPVYTWREECEMLERGIKPYERVDELREGSVLCEHHRLMLAEKYCPLCDERRVTETSDSVTTSIHGTVLTTQICATCSSRMKTHQWNTRSDDP